MGVKTFFLELFAPEGWPTSVAPEYGRYQLWDTIQQVTFFVNTAISRQAVMKFHGVGDPTKTPAEATALEMTRGILASLLSLGVSTPGMIGQYKGYPRCFRMSAEMLNACGHFVEILAGIFTYITSFLYIGPLLCTVAGGMSGAVRAVILQHFARGGSLPPGQEPDFGDISLKESNQDKGGKIVGMMIGIALLIYIGQGSSPAEEDATLMKSLHVFAVLTFLHIFGNLKAVQQLEIPASELEAAPAPPPAKESTAEPAKVETTAQVKESSFLKRMFLPRGYPHTVVDNYLKFRILGLIMSFFKMPSQVLSSMIFWQNVYGVGSSDSTPAHAVFIDIFIMSVDCFVGLFAGLPCITRGLDYSKKVWFIRATCIASFADILFMSAAAGPPALFFPAVLVSRIMMSFAHTSGTRVHGAVPNAFMRKECVERKEIELIDIYVSMGNQETLAKLPSGAVAIGALYMLVWTGQQPSLSTSFGLYCLLTGLNVMFCFGQYSLLTFLPTQEQVPSQQQPLLEEGTTKKGQPDLRRTRSNPAEMEWEERHDMAAEVDNSYTGPAAGQSSSNRSLM
mmetsp:Transcript_21618/g.50505  ORF Transcript_21618/g.50505 Transcript_21618/m.50505 type:complete len:566 (-) Transcript_21618:142-1839(-)